MCGRFAVSDTPKKLMEHFHLAELVDFKPSWNIAPSADILTIIADKAGARHMHPMRWGLIPSWAKDATIGNKLANARGETLAEKPSFRTAFKQRRCIVPATGFYEWKTQGGKKYPYYISNTNGEPMAFAGLWEHWQTPEGKLLHTCCLITTDPNEIMQPIHDRMPVILDREHWEEWLSPSHTRTDDLQTLIAPHAAAGMQAWPVTREVNKVGGRNDASLTEKVEELAEPAPPKKKDNGGPENRSLF